MDIETERNNRINIWNLSSWIFGTAVLVVGVLNIFLVHLIPGLVYLLLTLIYLPPAQTYFSKSIGITIPLGIKFSLGIILIIFTLGVSDLGDMIDDL